MTAETTHGSTAAQGWRESRIRNRQQRHLLTNVATKERIASVAAGGGLIYLGMKSRSLLGLGMAGIGAVMLQRGATGHCAIYESLNINNARRGPATPEDYFEHATQCTCVITINKSPTELYRFWRDLSNLPSFMKTVRRVVKRDDRVSHWVVEGIGGREVKWDAEIINDEPDHLIAWRSLGDADVANSGSVRFLPALGDRGTEMHVVLDYIPPAGKLGLLAAKLFGKDAQSQLRESMRTFKQMMETGEQATVAGQSRGTCGSC